MCEIIRRADSSQDMWSRSLAEWKEISNSYNSSTCTYLRLREVALSASVSHVETEAWDGGVLGDDSWEGEGKGGWCPRGRL